MTAVDPALAFRNFQLLNLKSDKLLSNVAFNCNLRHYIVDLDMKPVRKIPTWWGGAGDTRLTPD